MKQKIFVCTILLVIPLIGEAQFDKLKKAMDKGKEVLDKNKETTSGLISSERAKIDSTDFNYAITVIDNSGMMNIRDLKENITGGVKLVAQASKLKDLKEGDDVTLTAVEKFDWAERLYGLKQFKASENYFLQAKLAYETEKLTNHINYSKIHADLGLLYATMGRFVSAEEFTLKALTMREQAKGRNTQAYASSLNNLAVLYQETARFNEAEEYFEAALKTVAKRVGNESQQYAITLNNHAILFAEIGRIEQAVTKLNSAIDILGKLKGTNNRNKVGFQSNLALLYQRSGKYIEAEAIYLQLEKSLGSNDPFYAGVLNNLALLYITMGKPEQVEGYLKQSADVYKKKFGDKNPNYAKVLNDLGNFYRMNGRFDEAEKNLIEALTIRTAALDANHPDYVKSQEDLAILYWKKGDMGKADPYYEEAMDKSLDFISRYFPPMSEAEKTKFWDVLHPRFQRFFNYCLEASASNPTLIQTLYDFQMATKGLLLNSTNKIKKSIFASGKQDIITDYKEWLDKKETLARLYSLSKDELSEQKIDLASLEKEANDLERSLSQRSAEFSQGYAVEKINFKQVAAALSDTEAAIELIRIRSFDKDFTTDSKYAALVLAKSSTSPKLVVLENGNQLETRYAKFFRNAVQQKVADTYSYPQFWEKIDPALAGKKTIYISADGVYNQISLNTFKKPDGDYLLNRYDLVMLGNSKELISLKSKKPTVPKKNAFLLGFPDYGGDAVAALPGTKLEIENIAKLLKLGGYQAATYAQKTATEAAIKSLKGTSIVHIATHGYFQADVESNSIGVHQENAKDNPLLRSGLLLAGASPTVKGDVMPDLESNDNGVLTAYEAMNLDLAGTDLIVLSACETGLGDVRAGEGVYGLQRAFLVAGANSLIMSLWKVDDAATQQLMTNFYTNLTKTGNRFKAFKLAQQQLMVKYKDPYYWGAFVMMGM